MEISCPDGAAARPRVGAALLMILIYFLCSFFFAEEPKSKPILTIEKTKYSISELVRVNCTSYNGYPAPNITWFINSIQVSKADRLKGLELL